MATRMNMLKLVQEVRGFTSFPNSSRPSGAGNALVMPVRPARSSALRPKRVIQIVMKDPTDIPTPVKITVLAANATV